MQLRRLVWAAGIMGGCSLAWSLWRFPVHSWRLLTVLAVAHALFSLAFTFPLSPGRHLNTGYVLALAGIFALGPEGAVLAAFPGMVLALWQRRLGGTVWITYLGSTCTGLLVGGWIWRTFAPPGELSVAHLPPALAALICYWVSNMGIVSARVAYSAGQPFREALQHYLTNIGVGGFAISLFAIPFGYHLGAEGPSLEAALYLAALAGAAELARVYVGRQELERQARVDGLTGALNRAAWENCVSKWMAQGLPNGLLIVLDLDGLKQINDRYGHATGDEVLRDLVRTVQGVLRRRDAIYRYGGDEFVMYLLDVDARSTVLDRLRAALEDFRERWAAHGVEAGVSMGYAEGPAEGRHIPALFELADQRMYSIKLGDAHRVPKRRATDAVPGGTEPGGDQG